MSTKKGIRIAKDNGWVAVFGALDDLMEFEGALQDEGDCFDSGKVYFSKSGVYNEEDGKTDFQDCIEVLRCGKTSKDEDGNVIPWTYKTDTPHETFMMYEDREPYCSGVAFPVNDSKGDEATDMPRTAII